MVIPHVAVEVFAIPPPSLAMPYRWHRRWGEYLKSLFRRFDVVVVYFLHDWGFTADILQHGCLIASPRGSDLVPPPGEGPPSPELVAKRVELLRSAASVGVAGPSFARVVADFAGLPYDRIDRLPLGVDLDQFRPRKGPVREGQRVGFFKGFRPVYGARCLVQSIAAILAERPNTKFELMGDGPDLEPCQDLAARLGVTHAIRWLARRPHDQVPCWLNECDLTVMPSVCESFGLAALESSAMQVPVVASKVGGVLDTVQHERTGLLVPPGCPESLAGAVVSLLKDDHRRERLGKTGRDWVQEQYEWHRVLGHWEKVFEKAKDRVSVCV